MGEKEAPICPNGGGSADGPVGCLPDAPGHGAPRRAMALELRKLRRKHLPLAALALLVAQLAWVGASLARGERGGAGYLRLFYTLSLANAVFLPLLSAVVASTVADVENRGHMLKVLLTAQPASGLFAAKWATSAMALAGFVAVQELAFVGLMAALGFPGPISAGLLATYWASTVAVCLLVATIAQVLALFSASQFLALACGVALSFLGLFALYLPRAVAHLVPSAYFGLLSTVGMSYDAARGATVFYEAPWDLAALAVVVAATAVLYVGANRAFSRKELA